MGLNIEQLYNEYKQDVFYYLLSLTHDPTTAEDLLSETFVRAIKSLPTYRGDASIKTWLFGVARNVWLQSLKKSRNMPEISELMEAYFTPSAETEFIQKQTVQRVHELLGTRDLRTQKIVYMRIDGFSYADIAIKVGVSESSARIIDFRAKKWLRENLKQEGVDTIENSGS